MSDNLVPSAPAPPPAKSRSSGLILIPFLMGVIGFVVGAIIGYDPFAEAHVTTATYPLPHHIPKYPGNLTLRFAMVHDVIHERFPVHGADYYRARNRDIERALDKSAITMKGSKADEYFRLIDDWAVGLAFLGEYPEAVEKMRAKLDRQWALGYMGSELYSTYANLGTILIIWQLTEGVADAAKAKERIAESVDWIRKAIDVYPQSHFGRENWQVVLEEFLLAVLDKPRLLLEYDMVGNSLERTFDPASAVCFNEVEWLWRPPFSGRVRNSLAASAMQFVINPQSERDAGPYRHHITKVGAEEGWTRDVKSSHREPAPFDEPALAIVGMWRMGAGANPHFALALGEIMLRVGQRYIAWTAFERGYYLKEGFWPDLAKQERFGTHCRDRQRLIEASLPKEDWQAIRSRFISELELGQRYQKDYKEYEAARLAAGASVDDQHFYDDFESRHGIIATPVGKEDEASAKYTTWDDNALSGGLLGGGLAAFATAAVMWLGRRVTPFRYRV